MEDQPVFQETPTQTVSIEKIIDTPKLEEEAKNLHDVEKPVPLKPRQYQRKIQIISKPPQIQEDHIN